MVNAKSELYEAHPDWVLHAPNRKRTEQRNQLVLNLSLPAVQDYLISVLSKLLSSANVGYIKWDNNRSMHELSHPSTVHKYMFGLYRVLSTLTTSFPDILWEGCASGGGRFDPGILYYFPQTWTSDNTDGLERIYTQFGTTLAYPPSSMGCHVAAVPNHQMHRITPIEFRAHIAMMGGSFGFELDLGSISSQEKEMIPALIALAEKVNPYVIHGDLYRLRLPEESNWPGAMYIDPRNGNAVVLAYQLRSTIKETLPALKLRGLDEGAKYKVEGKEWTGASLMASGLKFRWEGDYQSKVIFVERV
jgi:alpha-galactosidase